MFGTTNFFSFNNQKKNDDVATVYSLENGKATITDDNVEATVLKNKEKASSNISNALFGDFLSSRLCSLTILDDRDDSMLRSTLSNISSADDMVRMNEDEHREQINLFAEYATKAEMLSLASFDSFDPEERHMQCSARRELVSPLIQEKMLQGYTVQNIPCLKCRMPLMERGGKVDCQVCPIIVQQSENIERAIKMKKLAKLESSLEDAEMNVQEAEEVLHDDIQHLKKLKNRRDWLEKQYVIVMESVKVAEEQAAVAIKKSEEVHSIALEARKLSDEAWERVNKKREVLKITKADCKATIELFVARIHHTMKHRQEVSDKMTALVKTAQNELENAKSDHVSAIERKDSNWIDAVNAAQAVQLAQTKQKEAEISYKEAQEHAKALSSNLENRAKLLQDTIQQTQEIIESFNQKVNTAIQQASTIEKQMEDNVLRAQIAKREAEDEAKKSDESMQYKAVRARVTERLVHLANENKSKMFKEYEDAKKELMDVVTVHIPKVEEDICSSDTQLKKLISLERIASINKLRRELEANGVNDDIVQGKVN